jgi:hypothetical protein
VQLWGCRRLVGVRYPRELPNLPAERLLIETLDIALGADLQRCVNIDLDEAFPDRAPHLIARLLERGDRRDEHPHPVSGQQVGDEADPQDVRISVLPRKAKALGEVGAHYVPV